MYWAGHPQARIGKDQQTPAETIFSRPGFITTDGLYRISGSHSDVQTIKQEIDKVSSLYPVSLSQKSDLRATSRSCPPSRTCTPSPAPSSSSWGSFRSLWFLGRCFSYQTSLCLEGWRAGENSDQLQSRINPDQNGSDPADNWKVSLEKSNLHVLESPLSLAGPQKATLQCILVHLAKVLFPPHNPHNLTTPMLALGQGSTQVAQHQDKNRMGASNLAIVFGPTMVSFFVFFFLPNNMVLFDDSIKPMVLISLIFSCSHMTNNVQWILVWYGLSKKS